MQEHRVLNLLQCGWRRGNAGRSANRTIFGFSELDLDGGVEAELFRFASRVLSKGRFAIVTNVGCGMRWTPWRCLTSGAWGGRRSRVVLIPRRWDQVGDGAHASR